MTKFKHEFWLNIPEELLNGVIYISMQYATAIHLCPCGCEEEVVTPFSPTDWELIFDGDTVSLFPSIGNWSLKCKSHYWIKNNNILWAREISSKQIGFVRKVEHREKEAFYKKKNLFNDSND